MEALSDAALRAKTDEFKKRLDSGETLTFGVISVFKHNPEDKETLKAIQKTAEHHQRFDEAMERAVAKGELKPL
jgi:predicted solute-binding protein